jgi:SNF family Na+-dependent transporter
MNIKLKGELVMTVYFIILAIIGIVSIAATFMIGNSQTNKEESNQYSKQSKGNILRLSYLNIISIVIWAVIMIIVFYFYK